MIDFTNAAAEIVAVGRRLGKQGLAPATAGNYSMRLSDGTIAVTVSGSHKARLMPEQVMRVDHAGTPLDAKRPSAETLLHCLVYAIDPSAGAVLHTHSVTGTVLSRATPGSTIVLAGYELLKIFPGLDTHEASVSIPLVDNGQDMQALANELRPHLVGHSPLLPAFYIRGHGLYAWGPTIEAAEALVEACEFLFACAWEETKLGALR